jgi:hypothetical protein
MAEVHDYPTHGVPVDYMDVQTIWNDRRESHINPLSSPPRREYDRAPGPSALGGMVDQIYRPGVGDNTYKEDMERLPTGEK